jgi:hypothetical protein
VRRQVAVIVRRDGESWAGWSPQCPGLAVVQPTAEDLRNALPGALQFYFDDVAEPEFHLEHELHGVVVRVAQDALRWERQVLAERVAAALGVEEQATTMRAAPANSLGDIVYVCALPSDTVEWVVQQMENGRDAVTVALPVADELIWTTAFATADGGAVRTITDAGYSDTTTWGEIMQTDSAARHIRI